jgi:hypothetical protein
MRHHELPQRRPVRRGIALIWIAIVGMVLIGLAGLALDTGYVLWTAHQLQNAADAAALAGANSVAFDTAQSTADAVFTAAANKAAGASVQLDAGSDVTIGSYDRAARSFSAGGSKPDAVKARARRTDGSPGGPLNLVFGPMFGISTSNVSREAIAVTSPLRPGVILLNRTANPSLELKGTGSQGAKVKITGDGTLVINSNSNTALSWNGQASISAAGLYITGNDTAVRTGSIYPTGSLVLNSPPVTDPFAALPPPAQGINRNGSSGPNILPGYYPNGLPKGDLTLAAGVYYIDGGISLKGNETINATAGVMIYLRTGGVSMGGNTSISISPPTSGTYKGISFYQDRSNSSPVTLQGTPGANNSGVLYFPASHVTLAGTPIGTGSQLIADTLEVQGNALANINYDNNAVSIPRHQSFLVR